MLKPSRILAIINPISGVGSKTRIPGLLADAYNSREEELLITYTKGEGHAIRLVKEAIENDIDSIIAVGGDGTVNEVGRALTQTDTAMGILPCGSGNGLARHLNLPMNLKKCIDILNYCDIKKLDYGIINEHPFFCTCGMGFDAFISMKFAEAGTGG